MPFVYFLFESKGIYVAVFCFFCCFHCFQELHGIVHHVKSRSRAGYKCQTLEADLVVSGPGLGILLSSVIAISRFVLFSSVFRLFSVFFDVSSTRPDWTRIPARTRVNNGQEGQ